MNTIPLVAGKPTVAVPEQEMHWSPVASPQRLRFNGTSIEACRKALTEAFGSFPLRLTKEKHSQTLWGMVAAAGDGATPYRELLDALERYSDLEVK
jgi:hypothetical protein